MNFTSGFWPCAKADAQPAETQIARVTNVSIRPFIDSSVLSNYAAGSLMSAMRAAGTELLATFGRNPTGPASSRKLNRVDTRDIQSQRGCEGHLKTAVENLNSPVDNL